MHVCDLLTSSDVVMVSFESLLSNQSLFNVIVIAVLLVRDSDIQIAEPLMPFLCCFSCVSECLVERPLHC